MEDDRRELRDYYTESSPARRRQILDAAMETQSDPEADEIRLQIWNLRYAKARENGKSGRADGYLKLWMDLRYLAENPPGRSVKKRRRDWKESWKNWDFSSSMTRVTRVGRFFFRSVCTRRACM